MRPRFFGTFGVADLVTSANAMLGFAAVVATTVDVGLAARLILLAAIADALDGILARVRGGSRIGPLLDSLADVASFGVAPAMLVVMAARTAPVFVMPSHRIGLVALGGAYVAMAILRLALYTALDVEDDSTEGVQTTLAGTIIAVCILAGFGAISLVIALAAFTVLMVVPVRYPDLRVRDAFVMGGVQALALVYPYAFDSLFPRVLLVWAIGYLLLGPWVYRRGEGKRS
ncbi:MAG: protein sorting system archaetidylserine synthase [Halodesulfurarchaeum sp.]